MFVPAFQNYWLCHLPSYGLLDASPYLLSPLLQQVLQLYNMSKICLYVHFLFSSCTSLAVFTLTCPTEAQLGPTWMVLHTLSFLLLIQGQLLSDLRNLFAFVILCCLVQQTTAKWSTLLHLKHLLLYAGQFWPLGCTPESPQYLHLGHLPASCKYLHSLYFLYIKLHFAFMFSSSRLLQGLCFQTLLLL